MNLELPLGPLAVERPHAVGAVVAAAKEAIEAVFRGLWIEGEISGIKSYPSGVVYFTLRGPDGAFLKSVVFRFEARKLRRTLDALKDGVQVYARGDLSVGKKSELELFVRELLPRPEGGFFQIQFERAHAALLKDGLLDVARKRALPSFPGRIAVVTSPEGAVWHDIVTTVERRWPFVELVLVPSRVQGEDAPAALCRALARAGRLTPLDVIIVARGGGSKEDLHSFNDEAVARAVAAAAVPVISAVGHETDVTLTDLVADARAATPTAAAELAVPDRAAVHARVASLEQALGRAVGRSVEVAGYRVRNLAHAIDAAVQRRVAGARQRARDAAHRIDARLLAMVAERRAALETAAAALGALSPLTVLARGYGVALAPDGRVLRRRADFPPDQAFRLRVVDGDVRARVEHEP